MTSTLRNYVCDSPVATDADAEAAAGAAPLTTLAGRMGATHLERRLSLEEEHERRVRRFGTRFFYLESWYSAHSVIRTSLRLVGLYGRARRNARALRLRENNVRLPHFPAALDGYAILQISDPHVDLSPDIVDALIEAVHGADYDLCVLTGDYRTQTFGPYEPTLEALARVRPHLRAPVYAVLGNHDSIRMVPGLELLDMRVLLNESATIRHRGVDLHLAGIDDAHHYRLHDLEKARCAIPAKAPSVLLSHTPEAYAQAADAGFDLMLSGHTHGGQICLPGGFPLITDADCPREFTKGAWRFEALTGYTSVGSGSSIVDVRLNCPPEVTLHRLRTK